MSNRFNRFGTTFRGFPATAESGLDAASSARDLSKSFSCLSGSLDEARGLPNECFTSEAFFALERDEVLAKSWTFAGRKSAIPNPGDVLPVEVAGRPVLLVREAENSEVRAFYNVCPHRGARLISQQCSHRSTIVCPYHAWTYGLDGRLKARPHFFGPDRHDAPNSGQEDRPRLFSIRTASWHDWVFVTFDEETPPFEAFLSPIHSQWAEYDLSRLSFAHELTLEFHANWKLVIENYFDFYHVFKVHPKFHLALSKSLRQPTIGDGHFLHNEFWEEDAESFIPDEADSRPLPWVPGPSSTERRKSVFGVLFPNTAINIHRMDLQFTHFKPLAPNLTRMYRMFYFVGEAATASEYRKARERTYEGWAALLQEDLSVCQRAQEGRLCEAYDGGRFAPSWDSAALYFHRLVADTVIGNAFRDNPGSKSGAINANNPM